MTHDFSSVKVGDRVTGKFDTTVTYINVHNDPPYIETDGGFDISADNNQITDLVFSTPPVLLPKVPGSVIKLNVIHFMLSNNGRWINQSGNISLHLDVDFRDATIVYDAGKE